MFEAVKIERITNIMELIELYPGSKLIEITKNIT